MGVALHFPGKIAGEEWNGFGLGEVGKGCRLVEWYLEGDLREDATGQGAVQGEGKVACLVVCVEGEKILKLEAWGLG